jgi:hypothetical protein
MERAPSLTLEQQKEATRRRAQGAALEELAHSYKVGISTIRRARLRETPFVAPTQRNWHRI